jgi:hypothetical protein
VSYHQIKPFITKTKLKKCKALTFNMLNIEERHFHDFQNANCTKLRQVQLPGRLLTARLLIPPDSYGKSEIAGLFQISTFLLLLLPAWYIELLLL